MNKLKIFIIHKLGGFVMNDLPYEAKNAWHQKLFRVWNRYDEGRMERRILQAVIEGKMPPDHD